jgi:hypothetical protein
MVLVLQEASALQGQGGHQDIEGTGRRGGFSTHVLTFVQFSTFALVYVHNTYFAYYAYFVNLAYTAYCAYIVNSAILYIFCIAVFQVFEKGPCSVSMYKFIREYHGDLEES